MCKKPLWLLSEVIAILNHDFPCVQCRHQPANVVAGIEAEDRSSTPLPAKDQSCRASFGLFKRNRLFKFILSGQKNLDHIVGERGFHYKTVRCRVTP